MATLAYFSTHTMESEAAEIARGLRRRDPDLLSRLIEQYQHRLFRYLVHLCGHRQTAEDLFQETWLRVLERGHTYDGETRFATWLFALARHLAIDSFRRRRNLSLDAMNENEDAPGFEPADASPTQLERFLTAEQRTSVAACLEGMPALYREVLMLRFQEELSLGEIARVADIPLATAKSRLYRALTLMGARLEKRHEV
jgi:RNA polymerase sigma-70 factor, ECF subfamily